MLSSSMPGWVKKSFVLPYGSFGPDEVVFSGDPNSSFGTQGNSKSNVGKLCLIKEWSPMPHSLQSTSTQLHFVQADLVRQTAHGGWLRRQSARCLQPQHVGLPLEPESSLPDPVTVCSVLLGGVMGGVKNGVNAFHEHWRLSHFQCCT
jgi:hypothetical protein